MKFSIFPQFGALNSKPVFTAFVQGAKLLGHEVVEHNLNADVLVIWSVLWHGRMEQNKKIWEEAKRLGKKVLILEVGCFIRGTTWRIGLNHVNNNGSFGLTTDLQFNRSRSLGVNLKPWFTGGKNIVICGQHSKSEQWADMPNPIDWLKSTIDLIKQHSDRPIIFRPHPRDFQWTTKISYKDVTLKIPKHIRNTYDDFDFIDDLKDAWAVVNPSSNTGILSILHGIPAFVYPASLAYPVANHSLAKIESPSRPSREQWLEEICHCEWTLEEIAQGLPLKRIFN